MGQPIDRTHFERKDFAWFQNRLAEETALLGRYFAERRFDTRSPMAGYELEGWLVDPASNPAPLNGPFLERSQDPRIVSELSKFNIELNGSPAPLTGSVLRDLERDLTESWRHCARIANGLGARTLMIGILPTVREEQLNMSNISANKRYYALNDQLLRERHGRQLRLHITGYDDLQLSHPDCMLEAAATSFQLHLQLTQGNSVRYYNAAIILSAPMVAVSANSPFLFGRELWDETRIPLFEQAVDIVKRMQPLPPPPHRVTFGYQYLKDSLLTLFRDNMERYPPLLPINLGTPPEHFSHLLLHNGTIWRWNRPVVGFNGDMPHLRLEHRVIPSGPTPVDAIANAALFYGLIKYLGEQSTPPEAQLPFAQAKRNFYNAARSGLRTRLIWLDGEETRMQTVLLDDLLPKAGQGLAQLAIAADDIDYYLGIIRRRVETGQNGAAWQRAYVARHGRDFHALTRAYAERSDTGQPVHEWTV